MSYQALARKWRPQDFAAVVGQEPVVTALSNAVADGRIAQAYIFSGIRGVGKTSVARILAKALNCLNGPDGGPNPEPCNDCTACVEITRGADLDVLEVDAATYSKVEQVRELNESLKYGPARDRYKVVVLDEIHRLSRQAFDALLKIVEEPPPRLVFIFATTEIDAVPATVLSRCQEYRFRRVPTPAVAEHLRRVADVEEIEVSDAALVQLARAGEGSVRDAVALLDQLATYGQGAIQEEDAVRVLGGVDLGYFARLLEAITAGESERVIELAAELEAAGWDPRHVHARFLGYCRAGLRLAAGASPETIDLPQSSRGPLAELAAQVGFSNLLRLSQLLLASEATIRRSEAANLAVEIAWLRAAELPRLVAIEDVLTELPADDPDTGREAPAPHDARAASDTLSEEPTPESPAPTPEAEPADPEPVARSASPGGEEGNEKAERSKIDRLLEVVNRRKVSLAAHLGEAHALDLGPDGLRIVTAGRDAWLERALRRRGNQETLETALEEVCGEAVAWRIESDEDAASAVRDQPETPTAEEEPAARHPVVQKALEIFGGQIESVEHEDSSRQGERE